MDARQLDDRRLHFGAALSKARWAVGYRFPRAKQAAARTGGWCGRRCASRG